MKITRREFLLAAMVGAGAATVLAPTIYLPLIKADYKRDFVGLCTPAMHQFLLPDNTTPGAFVHLADAVKAARPDWIRVYISWKDIETSPGVYNWAWYDSALAQATSCYAKVLATIARSPTWCAPSPGEPIYENCIPDYEQFVAALVNRYRQQPYNIHAWEIENEPDGTDPAAWQNGIACWGNAGAQYTHLLQHAWTTIKAADPAALVLCGGVAHEETSNFNINFTQTVLQNGGGQYVDAMNFHYYYNFAAYWQAKPCAGGALDIAAKTNCFRQLCNQYGFTGPLWCTETGYPGIPGNEISLLAQADYVNYVYDNGQAAGLSKVFWFALDTPLEGIDFGLITPTWLPKPALDRFSNLWLWGA